MRYEGSLEKWSWRVGRLFGIDIRIHFILLLYALGLLLVDASQYGIPVYWTLLHITIVFGSVLLHEFGHCFAAISSGGSADEIILWPLGGLAMCDHERTPGTTIWVAAAGPAVNLLIMLLTGAVVLASGHGLWIEGFERLMGARGSVAPMPMFILQWVFAVNGMLFFFNLFLPAYPLDGGRVLQGIIWRATGDEHRATWVTCHLAMGISVAMGLFGILTLNLFLSLIAIFVFVNARRTRAALMEEQSEESFDYGLGPRTTFTVRTRPSLVERWRLRLEQRRMRRQRAKRQMIERRVDDLLEKVHRVGLGGLTGGERRFLRSASKHYRRGT